MKEIDFIPEWYKAGRERKRRNVRHYTIMAIMFTLMLMWGFFINGYVAQVNAEVEEIQISFEKSRIRGEQAVELKNQIAEMQEKTALLDKIAARTKMTAILGELSYLIRENVILSNLSLQNELIPNSEQENIGASAAVVRASSSKKDDQDPVVPTSPSHCRVVITGIAASPADAAMLIVRLEEAKYFNQVSLVFSKPKKFKDKDVTEFEIRCYVADYQCLK